MQACRYSEVMRMADDDIVAQEEEIAELRAEVERLEALVADREARLAHLEEAAAGLRRELTQVRAEMQVRIDELAAARGEIEVLREQARESAAKYRQLLLAAAPEIPEELVTGETVAEVEASLEAARRTVARIREHLEAQARAERIPTGAPPRAAPDVSALSPIEKISLGLQQRQG